MTDNIKPLSSRLTFLADLARVHGHHSYAHEMGALLVELDAAFSYELAMYEQMKLSHPNTRCGYVLCSTTAKGHFSKWSKVLGGYAPENGPLGDFLVFDEIEAAQAALVHLDPAVRSCFRIFPIVLSAGYNAVAP